MEPSKSYGNVVTPRTPKWHLVSTVIRDEICEDEVILEWAGPQFNLISVILLEKSG